MKPNTLLFLQSVAGIASALPAGPRADAVVSDLQAIAKRATPSLEAQMQSLAQQLDAHKQAAAAASGLDTAAIPAAQLEQVAAISPDQLQAIADQMNAQFQVAGVDPAAPAPGAKVARQVASAQQIAALAQQLSENLAAAAAAVGINPATLPTAEQEAAMTPEEMQAIADQIEAAAAGKPVTGSLQARQLSAQQISALAQQLSENLAAAAAALGLSPTVVPTAAQGAAMTPEEMQAMADQVEAAAAGKPATGSLQARQLSAQQISALAQQLSENLAAAAAALGLNPSTVPTAEQGAAMTPEEMQAMADQVEAAGLAANPTAPLTAPKVASTKRADLAAPLVLPENPTEADLQAAADQMNAQMMEAIAQATGA